ncbi:MAG: cytochrome c biogenesis protein CcsA [Armatimonadota bacterium]
MNIRPDNFPIYIAFACAIISFIAYLALSIVQRRGPAARLAAWARGVYCVSVAAVAYASIYLLQQILSGARYDIAYINDYSGPRDALIYKISSLWAGQEGSMLFWALLAGVIGIFLARKKWAATPAVMTFWTSVQAFFLLLLVKADPFRLLAEFQPGMVGSGLNPLLKNPWMAIHPPVIFVGYAALSVPAAYAMVALLKGDPKRWVKQCLPWALFGWVSLSAGIILGMVWSYEVLGWGGYWGWDPVENASLIPWLTSTALVHGMLLQRHRGRAARGNIILAFATFLLVLYATFLTRSGVLSDISVHSFADLGTYGILLAFLLTYTVLCAGLLIARWNAMAAPKSDMVPASRDFVLAAGTILIVLFAAVVLFGTSYPLFAKSGLDPSFYNRMSAPIAVAAVVLIALASLLNWSRPSGTNSQPWSFGSSLPKLPTVVIIVLAGAIAMLAPRTGTLTSRLVPAMILASSVIALIVSVAGWRGKSLRRMGAYVAHAGVALMILGIVLSNSGKSTNVTLSQNGPSLSAFGYRFGYAGSKRLSETKEMMNIRMTRRGVDSIAPLAIEYSQRGAVRSPFIRSSLLGDLYISPGDVQGVTVTPMASMTEQGWAAEPVRIPGTSATLTLIGMQVEAQLARLQYDSGNGQPVEVTVSQGHPTTVDGYSLTFQRFASDGGNKMNMMSAGAQLAVSGRGLAENITIQVSTKPFIWLLWAGTALIIVGGLLAVWRRSKEKDGLLPDSDGSDG